MLGNCLAANANDLSAQNNCKSRYVCGSLNATNVIGGSATTSAAAASSTAAVSSTASSGGSSASATPSSTGSATSSPSPSSTSSSSFAVKVGQDYGVSIVAFGLVTLGALLL